MTHDNHDEHASGPDPHALDKLLKAAREVHQAAQRNDHVQQDARLRRALQHLKRAADSAERR